MKYPLHAVLSAILPLLLLLLQVTRVTAQSGLVSSYGCPSAGSQRILTNYGRYTFQLDLSPHNTSYLQPNMNCGILVIGDSSSRWLITIESVSLGAYQAEFTIQDGGINGKEIITVTSSGTLYRQVGTGSGSFNVRLISKSGPLGYALGVKLRIEHLNSNDCPSGWYTASSGTKSYCYGVPQKANNLTYDQATKACNMMLANLVMGNFDYDSIHSELLSAPSSVLDTKVAYWVGLYDRDGDIKFLNKYNTLDAISGRLCSMSSTNCKCVAYQSSRFYRDDCASRRQYVCYMPRGGTDSYYDINSLVDTASAVVTIVAIVLTVGFILAALISLIVVLICCIKRKSVTRNRNQRRRNADATGGFVMHGSSPMVASSMPQNYPTQAPVFTIAAPPYSAIDAQAPPYTESVSTTSPYSNAVYANGAFQQNGGEAGANAGANAGEEKPPSYNPDWSAQRVQS